MFNSFISSVMGRFHRTMPSLSAAAVVALLGSLPASALASASTDAFTIKSFKGNKYCELLNVTYKKGVLDFDMDLDATLDSSSKSKVLRNRCSMQVLIQLNPNYRIRTGSIAFGGNFDMADDAKVRLRVGYKYDRIGNNPPKLLKWFSPKDNGPFEVKTPDKMSKWSECGILMTLTAQSAVRIERKGTTSESNVIVQNAATKHGVKIGTETSRCDGSEEDDTDDSSEEDDTDDTEQDDTDDSSEEDDSDDTEQDDTDDSSEEDDTDDSSEEDDGDDDDTDDWDDDSEDQDDIEDEEDQDDDSDDIDDLDDSDDDADDFDDL